MFLVTSIPAVSTPGAEDPTCGRIIFIEVVEGSCALGSRLERSRNLDCRPCDQGRTCVGRFFSKAYSACSLISSIIWGIPHELLRYSRLHTENEKWEACFPPGRWTVRSVKSLFSSCDHISILGGGTTSDNDGIPISGEKAVLGVRVWCRASLSGDPSRRTASHPLAGVQAQEIRWAKRERRQRKIGSSRR